MGVGAGRRCHGAKAGRGLTTEATRPRQTTSSLLKARMAAGDDMAQDHDSEGA